MSETMGNTQSAAPLNVLKRSYQKHGYSPSGNRHYLYYRWNNIKSRCTDPNHNAHRSYLDRGIRMFQEWLLSPACFIEYVLSELGERPTPKHTLDRINNNGNYEPGNLRWATMKEQATNRRPFSEWKKRQKKEKK